MSTQKTDPAVVLKLPLWQILLILVGLPAIYMANSLMPWSMGLLRRHDHAFFLEFWASIAILHWGSVALVVVLLKRAGRRLADIGMHLSELRQNAPNPFNPTTTIPIEIPERATATLVVYDVAGRVVRTLLDEVVPPGRREVLWDGRDSAGAPVSSGVYFCRLEAAGRTATRKLVCLK